MTADIVETMITSVRVLSLVKTVGRLRMVADEALTSRERQARAQEVLAAMLDRPSAKAKLLSEILRSKDNRFQEFCPHLTRLECQQRMGTVCPRVHFRPVYKPHTDPSFGHCSYLNTCHRTATCKYMHFDLDESGDFEWQAPYEEAVDPITQAVGSLEAYPEWRRGWQLPPQWLNVDLRNFDFSVLGKFDVILADPPYDIHMSLPYGTMTDDELRSMSVPQLQDEGLFFLWVTGRALELGRELLAHWGYTRVDELIWVKIGQTQRLIRTGRTGHWLNHTKEHCLIGAKVRNRPPNILVDGPARAVPTWVNRGIDCDVIVSEVRNTSRKPDELYGIIERLCPGGRKIELFGRWRNVRPGWLTLGNQLGRGDEIHDQGLRERLVRRYPERAVTLSSSSVHA